MYYNRRNSIYEGVAVIVIVAFVYGIEFIMRHWEIIFPLLMILALPGWLLCNFLLENDRKNSIRIVRREFIRAKDTVANDKCTVKFYPDDRLIVMDNIADRDNKKRMFTLQKKDKFKVNKLWSDVCRVFDDYTTLTTLSLLLDVPQSYIITLDSRMKPKQNKVKKSKQINIESRNAGPKFVEMGAIVPDPYSKGCETPNKDPEGFVNIDNIQEAKPVVEREQKSPEFVNMDEVFSSGKNRIDINNAEAAELSILPGINIVLAKKLVEYRNVNGRFKNVEEFLDAAKVKEHFVSKIRSMVFAGEEKSVDIDDDNYEGRIVDF